jgi:DNA polymerase-3 subunit alpha
MLEGFSDAGAADEGGEYGGFAFSDGESGGTFLNDRVRDGQKIKMGGLLSGVRRHIVKATKKEIGFAKLEDLYGVAELMFSAPAYEKLKNELHDDEAVCIAGRLSVREGEKPMIRVDTVTPLSRDAAKSERKKGGIAFIYSFAALGEGTADRLQDVLSAYPGDSPAYLRDTDTGKTFPLPQTVRICDALKNEAYGILPENGVKIF